MSATSSGLLWLMGRVVRLVRPLRQAKSGRPLPPRVPEVEQRLDGPAAPPRFRQTGSPDRTSIEQDADSLQVGR